MLLRSKYNQLSKYNQSMIKFYVDDSNWCVNDVEEGFDLYKNEVSIRRSKFCY